MGNIVQVKYKLQYIYIYIYNEYIEPIFLLNKHEGILVYIYLPLETQYSINVTRMYLNVLSVLNVLYAMYVLVSSLECTLYTLQYDSILTSDISITFP